MDKIKLKTIIELHSLWISGSADGIRANLEGMQLEEIDISGANLEKANLQKINLQRANLANCNLTGAYLSCASLALANLEEAILDEADLENATLQGANLNNTQIRECNLRGAELAGTNFFRSSLVKSNLENTNLSQTSFFLSNLDECIFSSKSDLGQLALVLTAEQLQQIIFLDEIIHNSERVNKDSVERMIVTISGSEVSPYNTSLLLATINAAYNNMFYLVNYEDNVKKEGEDVFTEDENDKTADEIELDGINSKMTPFYQGVGASDDIFITSVRTGSQVYEIATAIFENHSILKYVAGIFTLSAASYTWFSIERKRFAETKKLEAETKKVEAETQSMSLANTSNILSFLNEEKNLEQVSKHLNSLRSHPELEKFLATIPMKSDIVKRNSDSLVIKACQPLLAVNKKLTSYNYEIKIELSEDKHEY